MGANCILIIFLNKVYWQHCFVNFLWVCVPEHVGLRNLSVLKLWDYNILSDDIYQTSYLLRKSVHEYCNY